MIEFVEVVGIAVALSIDAMVVALCWSASQKEITTKHVAKFAIVFGFFQALMPLLGWVAGDALHQFISQWDHWVAFVLLAGVAASMLKEAFGDDEEEEKDSSVKKVGRAFQKISVIPKAIIYILLVVIVSAYLSYFIITVGNDVFALVTESVTI